MALVARVNRRLAAIAIGVTLAITACGPLNATDGGEDARDAVAVTEAGFDALGDRPVIIPDDGGQPLTCDDSDGDGFGQNCRLGPDCNDRESTITDQCYRCLRPATGCPCTVEGQRVSCDALTDGDNRPGVDGTCHLGERVCTNGNWAHCAALDGTSRIITAPVPCGSACDPACRVETVCPDSSADLSGHSSGVVIGTTLPPGFCPTPGGIQLVPLGSFATDGGVPVSACSATGGTPCGAACCTSTQACITLTDTNVYPSWCTAGPRVPPPPVSQMQCGVACTAPSYHCGTPPFDSCCASTEQCRFGVCRTPGGACRTNADCPAGNFCDRGLNRCFPTGGGRCNCDGDAVQQGCLNSILAQGGNVVNGIFHTSNGQDARQLRFARYLRGLENNPTSCVVGRSNYQATGAYACTNCDPTICDAWHCYWDGGAGGALHVFPTISTFANGLDWLWTQHVRYNPATGAGVADGDGRYYDPRYGAIYDLGAPANRVAIFPITDHVNDSCLEPFEYSIWLSDNPMATTVAPGSAPDPSQWNLATLVTVYNAGWTRNPRATGSPSDPNDVNSAAFGEAVADGMSTVWALPCGFSFRYASIMAGNLGNPTGSCGFNSNDYELDAVAGLNVEGNGLSIFHELPFGTTAGPDGITFATQVRTADVYFLFDTTGSMGGELTNLKASLQTGTFATGCAGGIIGGIRCVIPDAWFGVGRLDDFAAGTYGVGGTDVNFQHVLNMTSDIAATAGAVNALNLHNGYDNPEIQVPALWAVASGGGIPPYWNAQTACTAGSFGYPCFRPGTIPIVMLFTDAMYHNGPGLTNQYNPSVLFGGAGGTLCSIGSGGTTTAYPPASATIAIPSSAVRYTYTGTTVGRARSALGASCASSTGPSALFTINITTTTQMHFDSTGSSFDTAIAVFNSATAMLACNDDSGCPGGIPGGMQSSLVVTLTPGTYTINLTGFSSSSGTFVFHSYPLTTSTTFVPQFADAVNALNAIGAKVIVINSCGGQSWCTPEAQNNALALANQTGSLVSGGAPAVYQIAANGSGLGSVVVNAVRDLANYSRMDVSAVAQDNPATPTVDERCFINNPAGTPVGTVRLSNTAIGETAPYAAGRCIDPPTTVGGVPVVARQCLPGSQVSFRADFLNDCVRATATAQTFTFDIITYGNGTYVLGTTPVTIVVPPGGFVPSGTFFYDVDTTAVCAPGEYPDWTDLEVVASTPTGTSINVAVQTAATSAALGAATSVALGTMPPATSPFDIGAGLAAATQPTHLPYLRVTFTLNSDATHTVTPVLSGYRVLFNCIPGF